MTFPIPSVIDRFLRSADVSVRKPIFVVGCGRSGTALLFNLLSTSLELVPTTGYPDGEDHVGWIKHGGARIAGLANPQGDSGHVGHHLCLYMDESQVTEQVRGSMHRYYALEVLKGRPAARVLNKCPHLSNKLRYVRAMFPDALFLHIIREPVAVVASWVKVMQAVPQLLMYWPEAKFPCWWVFPTPDAALGLSALGDESRWYPGGGLLRLADYWATVNSIIPKQLSDTPGQLLTIRYEELIARPREVMGQVGEFCGLHAAPSGEVAIDPKRNIAYRSLLTDEQVQKIIARCRPVANTFGYNLTETGGQ
jgi:hypothetical protein